ncbi:MAG: hypothetical protein DHS20C02_00570 [Micavibrio sp.]|nr:MAG: hypothetical protein DHS20C02_00570 [Micavibrio sp.]
MRLLLAALLLFLPLSAPTPANAQDYKTLLDIPEGATLVSLSATERVEVEQDLLTANLRYEAENTSAKELQDEINKIMQKAVDEAKKVKSVKVSTQQYYVHEYRRDKHAPRVWRGNQGLQIKGKTADELLELAGELQEMGLKMNGLSYSVSPDLMEETRENLLEETLIKLKSKAERTAKALGKSKADLLQVNVDMGGGHYAQPQMMRTMAHAEMAMDSKMAAPVAAPGQSNITLTVSAQALLK